MVEGSEDGGPDYWSKTGSVSEPASRIESSGGRLRFTVNLRQGETTVISWKNLLKQANSTNPISSDSSVQGPEAPHLILSQPLSQPPPVAPTSHRLSNVIEKIERMYSGNGGSDEEDNVLDSLPDDNEYDAEDSFIDDSELDEYFLVDNSAKLDLIGPITTNQQPKKRKHKDLTKGQSESDGVHDPNKGKILFSSFHHPPASSGQELVCTTLTESKTDKAENEGVNPSSPKKKRHRLEQAGEGEGSCKRCNCKKSKCLKLYCECFAAGVYCVEPCACIDCFNKAVHEETVLSSRKQIESRNPLAFSPKVIKGSESSSEVVDYMSKTHDSARHKRGCNCKKSGCLKKYCECYQGGVGCSVNCRCEGCKNTFGTKNGSCALSVDHEFEEDEISTTEKSMFKKTTIQNRLNQTMGSVLSATPLSEPITTNQQPKKRKHKDLTNGQSGSDDVHDPNKGRKTSPLIPRIPTNLSHKFAMLDIRNEDVQFQAATESRDSLSNSKASLMLQEGSSVQPKNITLEKTIRESDL